MTIHHIDDYKTEYQPISFTNWKLLNVNQQQHALFHFIIPGNVVDDLIYELIKHTLGIINNKEIEEQTEKILLLAKNYMKSSINTDVFHNDYKKEITVLNHIISKHIREERVITNIILECIEYWIISINKLESLFQIRKIIFRMVFFKQIQNKYHDKLNNKINDCLFPHVMWKQIKDCVNLRMQEFLDKISSTQKEQLILYANTILETGALENKFEFLINDYCNNL